VELVGRERLLVGVVDLSSTRNAPYFRMYASGVSPSFAAASGRPGTLCSKIQR